MKEKIKKNSINGFQTLISIYRMFRFSRRRILHAEKVQGKPCVILGEGPSLKSFLEHNVDKIGLNCEKICLNSFVKTAYFQLLSPKYYVFADPVFISKNVTKEFEISRENIFQLLIEKTKWDMKIFIPFLGQESIDLVDKFKENNNIEVVLYCNTPINGFEKFTFFCFNHNFGTPILQNVIGAAIYLAIQNGFKEIYLLGADHSWMKDIVVNQENKLLMALEHFYDQKPPNFQPIYSDMTKKVTCTMQEFMFKLFKTFELYSILGQYAKHLNVKIYNSTELSYIDVFEKRPL